MEGKYAFIDLETTGSNPSRGKIIEIAIVRIDNLKIIDRWSTLVNPGVSIPSFIQKFTGITDDMLIDKPIFEEIAEEVVEKLDGYTFVAHNVKFDHGFLRNELRRCGKRLKNQDRLCTVKLSKELYPEYKKHNLDIVSERLCLEPITDRHRALGDADLLYQFWKHISNTFEQETLKEVILKQKGRTRLPSQMDQEEFEKLPERTGVYMFYGVDTKRPIYVGKSKNIRDRVMSHFTQDYNSFRKSRMVNQIKKISYISKPGELSALLTESDLVKEYLPIFNKKLRRQKILYAIRLEAKDLTSGILAPRIIKMVNPNKDLLDGCYGPFRNKAEIDNFLERLARDYKLCRIMLGIEKERRKDGVCFNYELDKCIGTCNSASSADVDKHNSLLIKALEKKQYEKWPFEGMIYIQENCKHSKMKEIHLIKNWCLLGSFKSLNAMYKFIEEEDTEEIFDLDKYNLLRSFIKRSNVNIEEVNLTTYEK